MPQRPRVLRTEQELAFEFGSLGGDELECVAVGLDRGIALPVAPSDGRAFAFDMACAKRVSRKAQRVKRCQRSAVLKGYAANVRQDFAHKVSFKLAELSAQVFVFEDLKLRSMTTAPAPKQDAKGRYTTNGAAAKVGLKKALLGDALINGQTERPTRSRIPIVG